MTVTATYAGTVFHGSVGAGYTQALTLPAGGAVGDLEFLFWNSITPSGVQGDFTNNDWTTVVGTTALVRRRTSTSSDTYNFSAGGSGGSTVGFTIGLLRVSGAPAYNISVGTKSNNVASVAFPVITTLVAGLAAYIGMGGSDPDSTFAIATSSGTAPTSVFQDSNSESSGWTEHTNLATQAFAGAGSTNSTAELTNTTSGASVSQAVTVMFLSDAPPNVATWVTPDGQYVDKTQPDSIVYSESDPDSGDTQSQRDVYASTDGGTTWSMRTDVTTSTTITIPANTYSGAVQFQVVPYDSQGLPAPSRSVSLHRNYATPPTGPTFVSPTNGETLTSPSETFTISYPTLDGFRWRQLGDDGHGSADPSNIVNAGATLPASPVVGTPYGGRSFTATGMPNNTPALHTQTAVFENGLWSSWVDIENPVVWAAPPTPEATVTTESDDDHADMVIAWTTAAGSGDVPSAVSCDIRMATGDTQPDESTPWIRVATGQPTSGSWTYWFPASHTRYWFQVVAIAAGGTEAGSDWEYGEWVPYGVGPYGAGSYGSPA